MAEEKKQSIRDRFRRRKDGRKIQGHAAQSKRKIIRSYKSPGEK